MHNKKIQAALTALLMIMAAIPQLAAPVNIRAAQDGLAPPLGDISLDGRIEKQDLKLLSDALTKRSQLEVQQGGLADMNGDEAIDSFDLTILRKKLVNTERLAGLVINEVCSSNKESYSDAAGAYPDWIELYNGSDKDIDLMGIGLSDGEKNKFKFEFPSGSVIPADGYVVVFCDDAVNQADGEYHAAFKISSVGETIYLTDKVCGELDSVEVPELDADVTYGRYANGSENFAYLTATPDSTNNNATNLNLVEKPVFSVEGGFYDSGFGLALSDANGNEIYYTTDGSDPATSETAKLYSGEINIYNNSSDRNVLSAVRDISLYNHKYGYPTIPEGIDKGIIVRAVAKTSDGRYSDVVTNGYYIGKTASYYKQMKVVSMTTDFDNLFNEDTGAYMVGSQYYELRYQPEYVNLDPGDVKNPTNYNKDGRESEFPVNIQVYEDGKLEYTSDMGARISGNWTRSARQKSFRLYARSEYGDSKIKYALFDELTDTNGEIIDSFDKVTIRNGGNDNEYLHFRDAFIQEAVEGLSVDTMGSEPCVLFIDGEFWGFYMIREKTDGDYIESHYGIDKSNVTVLKNGTLEDGNEAALDEYKEFCEWVSTADMTDAANYSRFCETMDVQSFMDYMTVETYVNNSDWISETYNNNWMVWRAETPDEAIEKADGKWRFIFYDLDMSTSLYNGTNQKPERDSLNAIMKYDMKEYDLAAMLKSLMKNAEFAQQFHDNYINIIDTYFAKDKMEAQIEEYVNAYGEATRATFRRFGANWAENDYYNQVNLFKEFFRSRPDYAKKYLETFCSQYGS